jgi:hypothetical protein
MTTATDKITWEDLEKKGYITRYGDEYFFTDKIGETLKLGEQMQDYYKGEHTIIRTDKYKYLTQNQRDTPQKNKYCGTCGTKMKTMPCDSELTYCPTCDLDHTY